MQFFMGWNELSYTKPYLLWYFFLFFWCDVNHRNRKQKNNILNGTTIPEKQRPCKKTWPLFLSPILQSVGYRSPSSVSEGTSTVGSSATISIGNAGRSSERLRPLPSPALTSALLNLPSPRFIYLGSPWCNNVLRHLSVNNTRDFFCFGDRKIVMLLKKLWISWAKPVGQRNGVLSLTCPDARLKISENF